MNAEIETRTGGVKRSLAENFENYSRIMKSSQDKYERLLKLRRDIVIESKRIIFLLLSINGNSKKDEVILEAEKRLKQLVDVTYAKIGEELVNEDPHKYYRAVSPGNQEFIEALTLMEFTKDGSIKGPSTCVGLPFLPTTDYILGLADLTGELMRRAISNRGNHDLVEKSCQFMRQVYTSMNVIAPFRELPSKLEVMQASVCKVERVLYQMHIMGPLAITSADPEEDEGFQGS